MKIAVSYTGNDDKQQRYLDWLQSFSPDNTLVVLSYSQNDISDLQTCNGLVLTGGGDVDPEIYGQRAGEFVQKVDRKRDDFESLLLDHAFHRQMPVLGICRGMQMINVHLGGTLCQDLPSQGFAKHAGGKDAPFIEHDVLLQPDSQIHSIVGRTAGVINSYHHQGIDTPASDLRITATSKDNVVESMEWKDTEGKSFLLLVQWHPERMQDTRNPFAYNIGMRFLSELA